MTIRFNQDFQPANLSVTYRKGDIITITYAPLAFLYIGKGVADTYEGGANE